jgi:hypothetical protein
MKIKGGRACLLPWIACIIIGKIVMLLGRVPSLIKMGINPSFWK